MSNMQVGESARCLIDRLIPSTEYVVLNAMDVYRSAEGVRIQAEFVMAFQLLTMRSPCVPQLVRTS